MEPNVIYIIDDKDSIALEGTLTDLISEDGLPLKVESFTYDNSKEPTEQLKSVTKLVLERTDILVVLLDYQFISEGVEDYSDGVLIDLKAAGIQVILLTALGDLKIGRLAGLYDAYVASKPFNRDTLELLRTVIDEEKKKPEFYRESLYAEERFADSYDQEELSHPGTVAMMLWENEYVLNELKKLHANINRKISILDMGCGTGRFEELLITDPDIGLNISEFYAFDFSPSVLKLGLERLDLISIRTIYNYPISDIQFQRRIAENPLIKDENMSDITFDAVLICFGVLSFTQYSRTLVQINSLLKQEGIAIVTVYNRDSIYYDYFIETADLEHRPLITNIDRERNIMQLNDKDNNSIEKRCVCFSTDAIIDTMKGFGFEVLNIKTFPYLYGFISPNSLKLETQNAIDQPHKLPLSYTSNNLISDQMNSGFSKKIYDMDVKISEIMKNKGHYITLTIRKAGFAN